VWLTRAARTTYPAAACHVSTVGSDSRHRLVCKIIGEVQNIAEIADPELGTRTRNSSYENYQVSKMIRNHAQQIINTSLLVVLFEKRRLYSNVNHSDPNWKKSTRVRQS
jgi:hypothetical protein